MSGRRAPRSTTLRHAVTLETPVQDPSLDGAGSQAWNIVGSSFAEIETGQAIRSETDAGDHPAWARRSTVRMRYRADIRVGMRLLTRGRVMYVIAEPIEIEPRRGIEIVVEERFTGAAA